MRFVGDVHGQFEAYRDILVKYDCQTVQVGDMGLGFDPRLDEHFPYSTKDHFIRGNHDNPEVCRRQQACLPDVGFDRGIFWVAGAYSIDKKFRTIGIDWWEEEELSVDVLQDAVQWYAQTQPRIVLTHTCPDTIVQCMGLRPIQSRTSFALETMFQSYQPEIWVFGHMHRSWQRKVGSTLFVCLDELEVSDDF